MGREIRRVPPTWEHPRYESNEREGWDDAYKPLYDEAFDEAMVDWITKATEWATRVKAGETPDPWQFYCHSDDEAAWARTNPFKAYAAWTSRPPDPDSYRDAFTEEPTAYQVYETVSEGTPISPVFTTREALIEWCMQTHPSSIAKHSEQGWNIWDAVSREAAEQFVAAGWAPSLIVATSPGGKTTIRSNAEVYEK